MRALAVAGCAVLVATAGCSKRAAPRFNDVAGTPATAPATASAAPAHGSSSVTVTGEVALTTTQDFQCSYARDDFFIRGRLGSYQGVPVFLSINVEFYREPGTYRGKTQILFRRVSDDGTYYASWYATGATSTVLPDGGGATIPTVTLPPEPGTKSLRPLTIGGHFGCLGAPSAGPG